MLLKYAQKKKTRIQIYEKAVYCLCIFRNKIVVGSSVLIFFVVLSVFSIKWLGTNRSG